jgi:DNA repair exonuclease SbcCD ATPase subunit
MAFLNLRPAEQAGRLKQLIGLDFDEIEGKIRTTFEKRTEVNREHKGLIAEVEAFEYDASATEKKDPAKVREQLETINTKKQSAESGRRALGKLEIEKERLEDRARDLERDITRLEEDLEDAKKEMVLVKQNQEKAYKQFKKETAKVEEMEALVPDQAKLYEELEAIRAHNLNVQNTERRAEKVKARDEKRRESDALTRQIESLEEEKREALAGAKFPIEGLAFTAEGVTYNGQPLEQASSAEQLRVSVAISAAMNPEMPVMVLKDGSLLDKKSMRLLCELAKEHDLQVLVERIERDEFVSVVIEDGSIVDSPDAGNSGDNQESFTLEP